MRKAMLFLVVVGLTGSLWGGDPSIGTWKLNASKTKITGPGAVIAPYFIPDYINMLNGVNKIGQKGYACIFDQVPGKWKQEGCVSSHAMEVGYVFGDWDNSARFWPWLFDLFAKYWYSQLR